jgi:hypothetical protein
MEVQDFRVHRFCPAGLDPVTVYIEQYSLRQSKVTVQCFSRAWTTYWGGHWDVPVEEFMTKVTADYIVNNLIWGWSGMLLKQALTSEEKYLHRIVVAMQSHFASLQPLTPKQEIE